MAYAAGLHGTGVEVLNTTSSPGISVGAHFPITCARPRRPRSQKPRSSGALHVTANYHPGVLDAHRVAAAAELVAHDAVRAVDENGRRTPVAGRAIVEAAAPDW